MRLHRAFAFLVLTCSLGTAHADTFGTGDNAFQIEFVTVGVPGNSLTPYSQAASSTSLLSGFRMGKFEVPRSAVLKANAEASLGIPLGDLTFAGGNGPSRPATGMGWYGAAKFINWLNASTGNNPAYKFDSAGVFQLWTSDDAGYDPTNPLRNSLATYFLPSSYEWYRSGFYDPINDIYHDYPTGSNNRPAPVASGTDPNTVVYMQTAPADVNQAGGLSPFGTMGQGGNASEWLDTPYDDFFFDYGYGAMYVNGGLWGSDYTGISSWGISLPDNMSNQNGFRVAAKIPEPITLLNLTIAVSAIVLHRRQRSVRADRVLPQMLPQPRSKRLVQQIYPS
jgi:hypothetical protein